MSAVTPTSVLEGTENPGWRRERGPSTEAGVPRLSQGIDRGEKATFGGDRRMGAGCTFTQAAMETTMRSSTSTTNQQDSQVSNAGQHASASQMVRTSPPPTAAAQRETTNGSSSIRPPTSDEPAWLARSFETLVQLPETAAGLHGSGADADGSTPAADDAAARLDAAQREQGVERVHLGRPGRHPPGSGRTRRARKPRSARAATRGAAARSTARFGQVWRSRRRQ